MHLTNYFSNIHELNTCCFFLIYNNSRRKPIKSHENKIQGSKCTYKFDEYLGNIVCYQYYHYEGDPWMTSKDVSKSKWVKSVMDDMF